MEGVHVELEGAGEVVWPCWAGRRAHGVVEGRVVGPGTPELVDGAGEDGARAELRGNGRRALRETDYTEG